MKSPIEKSDDHLRLLGVITARWATLDLVLAQVISESIRDKYMGEDIYFSSSAQRLRFDLLDAVIRNAHWSEEDAKAISTALAALKVLWSRRNDILHNPAVASPVRGEKVGWQYSARITRPARKSRVTKASLSLKELEEHAEAVSRHGLAIWNIINRDQIEILERANGAR